MAITAEWYNSNENRAWPLASGTAGAAEIPRSILCDMSVCVPRGVTGVYLSMLHVTPAVASVSIGSDQGAVAVLTVGAPKPHYPLRMTPIMPLASAVVVFGQGVLVESGGWRCLPADGLIDPAAVRRTLLMPVAGIRKLGSRASAAVAGIVKVVPGANVGITHNGVNEIYVALASDAPSDLAAVCDRGAGMDACREPPIRSINGQPGPIVQIRVGK